MVDSLRELIEITLTGTMVRPFLVAHQMAERRVETHNVKVIVSFLTDYSRYPCFFSWISNLRMSSALTSSR